MNLLLNLVVALQIIAALVMIGLVLIQHGKGADMGASFGSGASGSLFGATGSANFMSRSTAVCAAVFFACTLALAFSPQPARHPPAVFSSASPADATPPIFLTKPPRHMVAVNKVRPRKMSGSLRLAGTATKFFGPGQTGKFVPSDDNMVATGRYTQEEPNAVATWLGNMLKLPPAKPEPLTYTPMPGRGIEVTVTGWENGVPRGNCQITSKDKPIGTPLPITGITTYNF